AGLSRGARSDVCSSDPPPRGGEGVGGGGWGLSGCLLLPPLAGGGREGGIRALAPAACPHPNPLPQAGEGVGSALPGGGARKRSHGFPGHGSGPAPAMAGAALRRNAGRRVVQERLSSGKLPVAVLVLLAAAAGARVVAADLGALAHDRGPRAMLVVGLRGFLVGAVAAGVGMLELGLAQARLGLGALLRLDRGHLLLGAHA